jgi:hypothetical protein
MQTMAEDSVCGICLMMDGRYVTPDMDTLHLSFVRVKESEFAMSPSNVSLCERCTSLRYKI